MTKTFIASNTEINVLYIWLNLRHCFIVFYTTYQLKIGCMIRVFLAEGVSIDFLFIKNSYWMHIIDEVCCLYCAKYKPQATKLNLFDFQLSSVFYLNFK
eukprot:sb/3478679/